MHCSQFHMYFSSSSRSSNSNSSTTSSSSSSSLVVVVVVVVAVTTVRYPGCNPATMFTCHSGACITAALVCNGERDCLDGSDEGPGCLLLTPQTGIAMLTIR